MTIGASVPRLERREKVTGHVLYTINLDLPGMLHAKILRSPVAHGRLVRIDASKAAAMPGVHCVLTRDDFADGQIDPFYGPVFRDQPIVAIDKVRFVGDIVAAVAAVNAQIAEEAAGVIDAGYEELPALMDPLQAIRPEAPLVHETLKTAEVGFADMKSLHLAHGYRNAASQFSLRRGDVEVGFREANAVVEGEFYVPAIQHAALEPHAAVAVVHEDGRIEVWSCTQNPSVVREQLATMFKTPMSKVRVVAPFVGGGYGAKTYPKIEPLAVALAHKARRPVKIVLARDEVFYTIVRHAVRTRMKTGATSEGRLVAREAEIFFDKGAYADIGPRTSKNAGYSAGGPYKIPHLKLDSHAIYTNKTPGGAYRGFGVPQVCWAYEQQMDQIAGRLGLDPLEFRLRNVLGEGDAFATGEILHAIPIREALLRVADGIAWGSPSVSPGGGRVRGKGLACMLKSTMTPTVSAATVKMEEDGSVTVLTGTVEIGQGSDTVLAQMAADALAVDPGRINVVHSDTAVTPYDQSTSSSRSTFSMGNAVRQAAGEVREQLVEMAARFLEVAEVDVILEDGAAYPKGAPTRRLSYAALFRQRFAMGIGSVMGRGLFKTEGGLDPETGQGKASAFWFSGAGACEVEVDTETGVTTVLKYVAAVNAGKVINPLLAQGQVEGSVICALGYTFYEEMLYGEGNLLNPNFMDYRLPTASEAPAEVVTILLEDPHPEGPYGAIGIGETAMATVAPAVANAIARATGVRIFDLPITPEKVLRGLRERQGAQA
ncbi:MAG: xanthine dehydrogenase family protein molybdopterin-binding subunit [Armatimonadota bacterium]